MPQECLPDELGGKAGTYRELLSSVAFSALIATIKMLFFFVLDRQLSDLTGHVDFFCELEKQIVDENKRTEKTEYRENMFGIDGTFKKLNID